MRRAFKVLLLAMAAAGGVEWLMAGAAGANPIPVPSAPPADREMAAWNNSFAIDLYGKLAQAPGNICVSPYSLGAALAMTWEGARGWTAEEMARVLHFDWNRGEIEEGFRALDRRLVAAGRGDGCTLSVARALWKQAGEHFQPAFLEATRKTYGAEAREVNFAAAPGAACDTINTWAAQQTRGRVTGLLGPEDVDNSVRLVLTDAVYFKAAWEDSFPAGSTHLAPFHLLDGRQVDVQLMHRPGSFRYAEADSIQVLEIPYAGHCFSMVVLLPRRADGLAGLEGMLRPDAIHGWLAGLEDRGVDVYLPRFRFENRFNLIPALQALGMSTAFSSGADFSGMTGERDLYISGVIQKTFLEVQERGAEAAAATAVVMRWGDKAKDVPPVPTFRADHPFLFLIVEPRTRAILFMGRVVDPSS